MLLKSFLTKLILLITILIYIGLPIINSIYVLFFFAVLIFIITGQIKKIKSSSILLSLLSVILFLCTFSFSFPKIQEGHNYLTFVKEDNLELKEALPNELYEFSKSIFNKRYPRELQCPSHVYGCWRYFGDIKRPYAFSADSFWQEANWSRVVNQINAESLVNNRTGFLNALANKGDTTSNWYTYKTSNPLFNFNPIRSGAPYFTKWRFPKSTSLGTLCTQGNIAKLSLDGKGSFNYQSSNTCNVLNDNDLPMDIIGLQFDNKNSFQLSYTLPKKSLIIYNSFIFLKILSGFILLYAWIKPRLNLLLPVYGISFLSYIIWNGKNLYLSNLNLYFGGGTDSLTHWGYGRWILESFKNLDFHEAFLGVESVYYFMPGYRYFNSIEMMIFGESSLLSYFSIILLPSIFYFILRNFLPVVYSLSAVLVLFIILPNYPALVNHYPECIGYLIALIGISYGILALDKSPKSLENFFLCSFFFGFSIFIRPNLLPASIFFILGYILFSKRHTFSVNALISCFGLLPMFLPLLHNLYFGNEFIILTKAATIEANVLAPPSYWLEAFTAILKGDFKNETLLYIANHFSKYIFGLGGIIFLLSVCILLILAPILLILGKYKSFLNLLLSKFDVRLKLLSFYWLGLQIMLLFYHPDNRYAVMSILISLIIFTVIFLKIIVSDHRKLIKKIDFFEEKELLNYPKDFISSIVQLWPLGKFPFASGTFCSIFFCLIGYYINLMLGWEYTLSLSILTLFLGIWTTKKYIGQDLDSDPKEVVIDEAVGQLIASASAGINIYLHLLSFVLFRFFDISKIGPIKFIENKGGAIGIMFDDVLAGIFSAFIILTIVNFIL